MQLNQHYRNLVKEWPYDWVSHRDIKEFSQGQLTYGSLRTICWRGQGPLSFKAHGVRVSHVLDMAEWLQSRARNRGGGDKAREVQEARA